MITNFTPLFDRLIQDYDIYTAAVFGRIWRFAQQETGVCYASLDKIGSRIGVSADTVRRRIETLMRDDWLLEKEFIIGETRKFTVNKDIMIQFGLFEEPLAQNNRGGSRGQGGGMAESNTKKEYKKDSKNIIADGKQVYESITGDVRKFFGLTPDWNTKTNQGIYLFIRERYDAGQMVSTFARWWFEKSWQGQQGQSPTPNQIREMWYQAFETREENDLGDFELV